jgi:general secretion pathway protein G
MHIICSRERRARRGFTFLEIIVVVAILGILAAIVVPNFMGGVDQAKVTATTTSIATVKQQLELYKLDNNRYPSTEQGLKALVEKPTSDPIPRKWRQYLPELPKDGWGNDFTYVSPAPNNKYPYEIRSAGPDGRMDTEDDMKSTDSASPTPGAAQ